MDSSHGTGDDTDTEEVLMFRCRECPGKTFTVAEKEGHRSWHRALRREQEAERNAAVRKTRSQKRDSPQFPSTDESEVTIFEPLDQEQLALHKSRKRRKTNVKEEVEDSSPSEKRKSRKWYNKALTGKWVKGTSG